eukprot:TRINITY_DN93392_c0_g1_i1.p1 TRINITY_DN93392_c0_g1~~TRINITY_DN93392_c0_g1_i1.p1  ORF type:complete len:427 (-),score=72.59 TRINITY_DN93392_c0_g1_i1:13-1293(-)
MIMMKQALRAVCVLVATHVQWSHARNAEDAGATEVVGASHDCFDWQCSDGYIPKFDHDNLKGQSDSACCQATCQLHTCKSPYVDNANYSGNIGMTDPQCCDKSCAAVTCSEGRRVPEDLKNVAGLTDEECCANTCRQLNCTGLLKMRAGNIDKLVPVGSSVEDFCCESTCASFTCDQSKGLAFRPESVDLIQPSEEKCCEATCASFTCPPGYEMPSTRANQRGHGLECCEMTCNKFNCKGGWVKDLAKTLLFGKSNEACCQKTCQLWECGEGWLKNDRYKSFVQVSDETCCDKSCFFYDQCKGDYSPDYAKINGMAPGTTADECCIKQCSLYQCKTGEGILIPNPSNITGQTAQECCEDERCPAFRNKTQAQGNVCNGLTKETCPWSWVTYNNTKTQKEDVLGCQFKPNFGLCMLGELEPTGCHGM